MSGVPLKLTQHIRELCTTLREKDCHCQNTAIINYREFLRGNITGVIEKSFPALSAELGAEKVAELTDDFLANHGANEPEFHHIATEFVAYLQHCTRIDAELRMLAEYEWVLFSVEIDPEKVIPGNIHYDGIEDSSAVTVILNPTLKYIRVPFTVQRDEKTATDNQQTESLAIFRNKDHQVMKKKLAQFDCMMLHLILEKNIVNLARLQQAISVEKSNLFAQWITCSNDFNLISLQEHKR